jgi:hypothetical protein
MASKNRVNLVVVVNTEDVAIDANVHWKLRQVAEQALNSSESKDRELSDFDLKDARGTTLDLNQIVENLQLSDGAKLFLSLKVGVQG